jgi:hypothetical protein
MSTQTKGLIAVLDALGAATYSDLEIDRFLKSRELVLDDLEQRSSDDITGSGTLKKSRLRVFTFNDTVVIVYLAEEGKDVSIDDIERFGIRLRAFLVRSLRNQILFRGSLSIGSFHSVEDKTNTVMGAAVSDAAAWYDKTDWMGIAATPHAQLHIQSLLEQDRELGAIDHVLVDYDVPLKGRSPLRLKAINWPKGFYVKGLRPKDMKGGARAMLLALLSQHQTPLGTESKFFNTVAFFDHVKQVQKLGVTTKIKDPSPAA